VPGASGFSFVPGLILLVAGAAVADCDPRNHGDCCAKDLDCVAVANEAVCAVVALNRTTAAKLEKDRPPRSAPCDTAELERARVQAEVRCIEHVCELLSVRFSAVESPCGAAPGRRG
jgi:hypothetical protein